MPWAAIGAVASAAGAANSIFGGGPGTTGPGPMGQVDAYNNLYNTLYNSYQGPQVANPNLQGETPQGAAANYAAGQIANNPNAGAAQTGAGYVAQYGAGVGTNQLNYGGMYYPYAQQGTEYGAQGAAQGFDPYYGQAVTAAENNPYLAPAQAEANKASGYGTSAAAGAAAGVPSTYADAATVNQYGQTAYNQINNAAGQVANTAGQISNTAGQIGNTAGQIGAYGAQIASQAPGVSALSAIPLSQVGTLGALQGGLVNQNSPLAAAQSGVLNTGFDPQQALYNKMQGQSLDASNVANAMAGVASTPYGASVNANALNNFNINWQNQQLARQTQSAQAAQGLGGQMSSNLGTAANVGTQIGGLGTAAGNLQTAGANILNQAATVGAQQAGAYGQAANAETQAANAYGQAGGLNASAADTAAGAYNNAAGLYQSGLQTGAGATQLGATAGALPSNQYNANLSSVLPYLSAQQAGAQSGANTYNTFGAASGNAATTGSNLQAGGLNTIGTTSAAPYNTYNSEQQNALTAATQAQGTQNAGYYLPITLMNSAQGSQSGATQAALAASTIQNTGFSQATQIGQGLGTAIAGLNNSNPSGGPTQPLSTSLNDIFTGGGSYQTGGAGASSVF